MAENSGGWGSLYNGGVGIQGGFGGTATEYSTWSALMTAIQADDDDADNSPKIYVYTGPDVTLGELEVININGLNRKTILGLYGQTISRGAIRHLGSDDLIWRNWKRRGPYVHVDDQGTAKLDYFTFNECFGIWLDHIDMDAEFQYSGAGDEYPDGMIDSTKSNYLVFSNCRIWNGQRGILLGYSDTESANIGLLNVTMRNCWVKNIGGRGPKCRFGKVDLYNNYNTNDPVWDSDWSPLNKPSGQHFGAHGAGAQIWSRNNYNEDGQSLFRDDDGGNDTSGVIIDGDYIGTYQYTGGTVSVRTYNVTWDPTTEPGYGMPTPLLTPVEARAYAIKWAGATHHLKKELTLNESGSGTATEVSTGPYQENDPVEVLATPDAGWVFVRWEKDSVEVSTDANYLFNMPADDVSLVAVFEEETPTYVVTVTVSPAGYGTASVSPEGPHVANTEVTLSATPASGKQFVRWVLDGATFSEENPHSFFNPGFDYDLVSEFEDIPPPPTYALTLDIDPAGGGTAEQDPAGPHEEGTSVTLTATPAAEKFFAGWYDGETLLSTDNPYAYTTTAADKTLTAAFEDITYALTLEEMPEGAGVLTGAGSYAAGTVVGLGAQAAAGYAFAYWMEDQEVISTDAVFDYTMPGDPVTLIAFFESTGTASEPGQFQLILSTSGTAGVAEGGGTYTEGSMVTVTATPLNVELGGSFLYWKSGEDIVSYDEEYTFAMPGEETELTAYFELTELSPAQPMAMVRDFVKVSLTPEIPAEGIVEMACTLRIEKDYGSGDFEEIAEYINPYLYDLARVDFHLDRALLARMAFHRPDLSASLDAVPCTGVVQRYGYTHQLLVDGEPSGSNTVVSGLHAWLAGRPYTFPAVNPYEDKAYLWLTTRPMVRYVRPMERNIFYILPLETGEHTLEAVIHYKNTIEETVTRSLGSQQRYRPFFFRYFLPEDWQDIVQIELAIRGRILAEEVLTLRPLADPEFAAQVFFGNSLGGFDSFCFSGKKEHFSETGGELFERSLQPDHDRQEGTISAYNRLSYDSLLLRTGYISLPEKNALKDMSLRNHIYLVDGTELRRILMDNTETFDSKDGTYIHSAEYRARLAFENHSYYGRDPRQ